MTANNEPGGAWDQQREIERLSPKPMTEPRTRAGKALLELATEATGGSFIGVSPDAISERILAIEAEAAHPDGYSEPPEPDEAASIVEAIALLVEGEDDSRPLLDSLPVELTDRITAFLNRRPVSGYSEPGMERDREAAVRALAEAMEFVGTPTGVVTTLASERPFIYQRQSDAVLTALNPEAAATLAAYLGGASPQPKGLLSPTIRTSNFGDWLDFGIGGSIVVGVSEYGIKPLRLLLSHQLYVHTANEMLAEYPAARGLAVLEVGNGDWLEVPRAALSKQGQSE